MIGKSMTMVNTWKPDDFADQTRDGHLFLSDKMAHKYGIDAKAAGWERELDLCGWRSPYLNPWTVIHYAATQTTPLKAANTE
jgi:hypothetical protein